MDIPKIKIELDGVKRSVMQAMLQFEHEYGELIKQSVERQLNEEWVAEKINKAVAECIYSAIGGLVNDYHLKTVIKEKISKSICSIIEGNGEDE